MKGKAVFTLGVCLLVFCIQGVLSQDPGAEITTEAPMTIEQIDEPIDDPPIDGTTTDSPITDPVPGAPVGATSSGPIRISQAAESGVAGGGNVGPPKPHYRSSMPDAHNYESASTSSSSSSSSSHGSSSSSGSSSSHGYSSSYESSSSHESSASSECSSEYE